MTVAQLIAILMDYPPELEVLVSGTLEPSGFEIISYWDEGVEADVVELEGRP